MIVDGVRINQSNLTLAGGRVLDVGWAALAKRSVVLHSTDFTLSTKDDPAGVDTF